MEKEMEKIRFLWSELLEFAQAMRKEHWVIPPLEVVEITQKILEELNSGKLPENTPEFAENIMMLLRWSYIPANIVGDELEIILTSGGGKILLPLSDVQKILASVPPLARVGITRLAGYAS